MIAIFQNLQLSKKAVLSILTTNYWNDIIPMLVNIIPIKSNELKGQTNKHMQKKTNNPWKLSEISYT